MKSTSNLILGIIVMALAIVCVWEYTIISGQRKDLKARQTMIEAQAVRARDLQQQIVDKDAQLRLLMSAETKKKPNVSTIHASQEVKSDYAKYKEGLRQRQQHTEP